MINAWAIARNPTVSENPEEFQPEMFCNTVIDFKWLNFAIGVVGLALAKLMYKFNFTIEKHLDMIQASGAAVYKKFPLLVIPRPHSC